MDRGHEMNRVKCRSDCHTGGSTRTGQVLVRHDWLWPPFSYSPETRLGGLVCESPRREAVGGCGTRLGIDAFPLIFILSTR